MLHYKRAQVSSWIKPLYNASPYDSLASPKLQDAVYYSNQTTIDSSSRYTSNEFNLQSELSETYGPSKAEPDKQTSRYEENVDNVRPRPQQLPSDLLDPEPNDVSSSAKLSEQTHIKDDLCLNLIRRTSISSGSSEEVILFEGRNHLHDYHKPTEFKSTASDVTPLLVEREPLLADSLNKPSRHISHAKPETLSNGPQISSWEEETAVATECVIREKDPAKSESKEQKHVSVVMNNTTIDRKIALHDATDDYIANLYEHDMFETIFTKRDDNGNSGTGDVNTAEIDVQRENSLGKIHSSELSFIGTSNEELAHSVSKANELETSLAKFTPAAFQCDQKTLNYVDTGKVDMTNLGQSVKVFNPQDVSQISKLRDHARGCGREARALSAIVSDGSRKFDKYVNDETNVDTQGLDDVSDEYTEKQTPADEFALSDVDLLQTLENYWTIDRRKKKAQKLQTEELRAPGSCGRKSKGKKQRARQPCSSFSVMDELVNVIKAFLIGEQESCALPPMNKGYRKAIHEIAHVLGLKSSSKGTGHNRFPMLYKTRRTNVLDQNLLSRLDLQLHRRLPRSNTRALPNRLTRRGSQPKTKNSHHGGYVDGEIVGSAAPELSTDNRGRVILEKMGWSSGTALGAINNKGILQPVAHVVKRSKAGLG